jgi:hypothetical protein
MKSFNYIIILKILALIVVVFSTNAGVRKLNLGPLASRIKNEKRFFPDEIKAGAKRFFSGESSEHVYSLEIGQNLIHPTQLRPKQLYFLTLSTMGNDFIFTLTRAFGQKPLNDSIESLVSLLKYRLQRKGLGHLKVRFERIEPSDLNKVPTNSFNIEIPDSVSEIYDLENETIKFLRGLELFGVEGLGIEQFKKIQNSLENTERNLKPISNF